MENRTRAASFCSSLIPSSHFPELSARSIPSSHGISFQNLQLSLYYEYLFLLTSYSAFSDHVDLKYWGCLHFRILCSLTFFPVCFFRFYSILLASSMIRRRVAIFAIQYSIGIFGTGLIFLKRLERVISSGEVSEESIVLRVLYDGSGEMEHLHQQQRKQLYSKQIQRGAPCDVE